MEIRRPWPFVQAREDGAWAKPVVRMEWEEEQTGSGTWPLTKMKMQGRGHSSVVEAGLVCKVLGSIPPRESQQ